MKKKTISTFDILDLYKNNKINKKFTIYLINVIIGNGAMNSSEEYVLGFKRLVNLLEKNRTLTEVLTILKEHFTYQEFQFLQSIWVNIENTYYEATYINYEPTVYPDKPHRVILNTSKNTYYVSDDNICS